MTIHKRGGPVFDQADLDQIKAERIAAERKSIEERIKRRAASEREEPGANNATVNARRDALLNLCRSGAWDRVYKQFEESPARGGIRDFWNEDAT